jgi:toxin ParE1/3/4
MSSPEYRLVLSPKAERDIENILRYTGETWGERQLSVYRDEIARALEELRTKPRMGHLSVDLPDTHRLHPFGSHVVIYRLRIPVVEVIRILHKRMSVSRQVD